MREGETEREKEGVIEREIPDLSSPDWYEIFYSRPYIKNMTRFKLSSGFR